MTESEMTALREMFMEMAADLSEKVERSLKPQYLGIQKTVDAIEAKVDRLGGKLDQLVARVDVNEEDVRNARHKLALLTQAKDA